MNGEWMVYQIGRLTSGDRRNDVRFVLIQQSPTADKIVESLLRDEYEYVDTHASLASLLPSDDITVVNITRPCAESTGR